MFSVLLVIMEEKLSQTDTGQNDNRFYSETIATREKRLQNQTEPHPQKKSRNLQPLSRGRVGTF